MSGDVTVDVLQLGHGSLLKLCILSIMSQLGWHKKVELCERPFDAFIRRHGRRPLLIINNSDCIVKDIIRRLVHFPCLVIFATRACILLPVSVFSYCMKETPESLHQSTFASKFFIGKAIIAHRISELVKVGFTKIDDIASQLDEDPKVVQSWLRDYMYAEISNSGMILSGGTINGIPAPSCIKDIASRPGYVTIDAESRSAVINFLRGSEKVCIIHGLPGNGKSAMLDDILQNTNFFTMENCSDLKWWLSQNLQDYEFFQNNEVLIRVIMGGTMTVIDELLALPFARIIFEANSLKECKVMGESVFAEKIVVVRHEINLQQIGKILSSRCSDATAVEMLARYVCRFCLCDLRFAFDLLSRFEDGKLSMRKVILAYEQDTALILFSEDPLIRMQIFADIRSCIARNNIVIKDACAFTIERLYKEHVPKINWLLTRREHFSAALDLMKRLYYAELN